MIKMKKLNAVWMLMASAMISHAQITLTTTDMPLPGWTNVEHKDTNTRNANFGNRGANQVYDFGSYTHDAPDTVFYLTPTSAQLATVPNANIAITGDRVTYLFGRNAAAKFDFEGAQSTISGNSLLVAFSPVDDAYQFPVQYSHSFLGSYAFTKTVPGSAVGQSSVYQVRVTSTTSYKDTIDGWGKVITPVGSYKCLRQKRIEVGTTQIDAQVSQFIPVWTPVQTINTNTTRYNYLTKETHGTVISFSYDSANNPLTASWSTTPPAAPLPKFTVSYGPNGQVAFHDSTDGYPDSYSWNFGDGSAISAGSNPIHIYAHDTTVVVCLTVTNAGGSNTWCDTIRVTNVGVPVAPQAVNDSTVMTQPATLSLHVLVNDVNNNTSDTVCINSVTGGHAGWATVTGCTTIAFHPLDSSYVGADTFYYRACSVHYPTLCDTGRVIVTIRSGMPVPSFNVSTVGCSGRTFVSHSILADSLFWHFSQINATGTPFDTLVVNGNIVAVPNNHPSFYNKKMQVCLEAKNNLGTAQICDTIVFGCGLGISELTATDYRIYPNPASDKIQIDLSRIDANTLKDLSTLEVYDLLGAKVKAGTISAAITSLDVNDLSNGVYFLMITDIHQSKKVVGKFEIIK